MIFQRDDLYRVVCNIRVPLSNGQEELGTGMFVGKGNSIYILTASHVVRNHNQNTAIIFCDDVGNSTRLLLSVFLSSGQWKHHPTADLAYIPLTLNRYNQKYLQNRFFPFDHISFAQQPVSRDVELTSIGFPLGLGSSSKFSPLSFRTFASSALITLERADTHQPADFFILENPSIGGYSGGPIFDLGYIASALITQTKEKTICYGFMHGTISDETGGKLAAVTPSYYLDGWI